MKIYENILSISKYFDHLITYKNNPAQLIYTRFKAIQIFCKNLQATNIVFLFPASDSNSKSLKNFIEKIIHFFEEIDKKRVDKDKIGQSLKEHKKKIQAYYEEFLYIYEKYYQEELLFQEFDRLGGLHNDYQLGEGKHY